MKKVLIVISGLNKGGTESFLYEYYKCLVNKSIEATILSFSNNDQEVIKKFQKKGFKIVHGEKPIFNNIFKFIKSFTSFLKKEKFDIVHCNCNFDNALFLYFSFKCGVPVRIGHYHDTLTNIKFNLKQKIFNSLKRKFCRKYATKSFGCSEEALEDILGKNNNGVVIENIVDFDELNDIDSSYLIELQKKYNLENYTYLFGNISRFEDKKNQKFLLPIFRDFLKSEPLSLLVLGGTGDSSEIEKLAKDYGIEKNVLFIGPRSDVKYWYKVFTLYLMPSIFEGFGISAVESQCCGCYVLASVFLPSTTDFGNISYLPLDKAVWLDAMSKKHIVNKIKYDTKEKIDYFLNELIYIK